MMLLTLTGTPFTVSVGAPVEVSRPVTTPVMVE